MQVNELLEQRLWSVSRHKSTDKQEFVEALNYLVKRFGAYLQLSLEVSCETDAVNENSFCWAFNGTVISNLPLELTVNGVIGMDMNYDEDKPIYSASLFLFSNHQRLITNTKPNRSYIELLYERGKDNIGQWRSLDWRTDDYGEFEDVEEDSY